MKSLFGSLSAALLLSAAATFAQPASSPPGGEEATLRQLNADYVAAFLKSDVKRYDELLAPDFRCITPSGKRIDRVAFLTAAAAPSGMASFSAEEVAVQILGDVAIVQARTPWTALDGRSGESRYTDVWVRRNGRWLTLSAQITPVKGP